MVSIVKFAIAKLVYGLLAVFFLPLFGMSLCHFSQQLRKNEAKQKEKKNSTRIPSNRGHQVPQRGGLCLLAGEMPQ